MRSVRLFIIMPMIAGLLLSGEEATRGQTLHQHYDPAKAQDRPGTDGSLAPRLRNLGNNTFPVTTTSEHAQMFINQGVNLSYSFNHAEAGRAFREAARLDPDCAMAYWGQALVLGPNINAPMDPKEEPVARKLIEKALALKSRATRREQAYIEALSQRYSGRPEHRAEWDRAYADAMRKVHQQFPDDLDAAALFAEAMMDLRPWDYWMHDGSPYPGTREIETVLQEVMARNPNHPGANHFWIHLMEPTSNPGRAESAADRLLHLAPAAGHLVHMPSHIYVRIGRYADAARANELAVLADEDYITQCRIQGFYPISYYPHNIHFLWFAETMRGRSRSAVEAAHKVASKLTPEVLQGAPALQFFAAVPYSALVRFGKWEEILREPRPPYEGPLVMGMWYFARGMAFSAKKQFDNASAEIGRLRKLATDPEVSKMTLWSVNSVGQVLSIGLAVLEGDLAARREDYEKSVMLLDKAVRLEDGLVYTEPPDWSIPARHVLGAVLLEAGYSSEAETVYWEDLRRNPENGWSLFGLREALRAQNKDEKALAIEQRFLRAWADADISLSASRF